MATRFPLYWNGSSPKTMTSAMVDQIRLLCHHVYYNNPSVTLIIESGDGGNLGNIDDTRLKAGAYTTHVSSFQNPNDVTTKTVGHNKISQAIASVSNVTTNPYPCYYDSGNIKHMTQADVHDTFIKPAIESYVDGSDRPGTYKITTSSGGAMGLIFTDTRADASAYTAAGVPETRDQPTTITTFYLHRNDTYANAGYTRPLMIHPNGNLQAFEEARFQSILQQEMRYVAVNTTSYRIRFGYNGGGHSSAGQNMGSGITDTKLNSQTQLDYEAGADDYRSQDVPAGSPVTQNTTYLRIRRE